MASYKDFFKSDSKYLKADDFSGVGETVTIKDWDMQTMQDGTEKMCIYFKEHAKPLVLNITNGRALEGFTGSDDPDKWIGKKAVAYCDDTIPYAGKLVSGVRFKPYQETTDLNDDISHI